MPVWKAYCLCHMTLKKFVKFLPIVFGNSNDITQKMKIFRRILFECENFKMWCLFFMIINEARKTSGVPSWLSGLRIWHYHCCSSGYRCGVCLIPGPGTSACCRWGQEKKKKKGKTSTQGSQLDADRENMFNELKLLKSKKWLDGLPNWIMRIGP